MSDVLRHDDEPTPKTQPTQPKKGKPVEIPIPKKGDVMSFLEKAAKTPDPDGPDGTPTDHDR
jgi:hypothetical protein